MHIKAIHTSKDVLTFGDKYSEMLWHTGSQSTQSSLLWYDRNKIPWEFNQAYRWSLKHRLVGFSGEPYHENCEIVYEKFEIFCEICEIFCEKSETICIG